MEKKYKVVYAKRDSKGVIFTTTEVFKYKKDAKNLFNSLRNTEYAFIKEIWV